MRPDIVRNALNAAPAARSATMRTATRTVIVWGCSLALLLPLLSAAAWIIFEYWRELTAYRPAEAFVVEAEVRDGPGRGLNYYAHIRYRYQVDGVRYVSERYRRLDWSSSSPRGPQAIVDHHPTGSHPTAWYDPEQPAEAVLSRELNRVLLLLALSACSMPIALLILYYRMSRPGKDTG